MIEVELPDGRVLEVETTDPNVAAEAARKFISAQPVAVAPAQAARAAPPASAPGSTPARGLQVGTQGVGRGLAHLAGGPVDLVTGLVNAGLNLFGAPAIQKPYGGSERLKDSAAEGAADALSGRGPQPHFPNPAYTLGGLFASLTGDDGIAIDEMTDRERLAYNINDFGGQAALGAAGLARTGIRKGVEWTEGALPRFWDELVRPYATSPGRTYAGDVAGGAGAGVGVTAAEEYLPDNPVAQAFAAL